MHSFPVGVSEEFVGREGVTPGRLTCGLAGSQRLEPGHSGYAESIERDIPNQLLPVRTFQVLGHPAGHVGAAEASGDFPGACPRRPKMFAEDNQAVGGVADDSRRQAVEADEAQTAQHPFRSHDGGHFLLVAESVLEADHRRVRADQRRQQLRQLRIGGRFQADENDVAGTDLGGCSRGLGPDVEIAVNTPDIEAVLPDGVVVGTQQEVHVLARPAQLRAVVTADGAAADDGDSRRW
jgi:hypothetical protein